MSYSLLMAKVFKPVAMLTAGFIAYKGYEQWDQAKTALGITPGMTPNEMSVLFDNIDADKSGQVSAQELQEALHQLGVDVNKVRLKAMMIAADGDGNGELSKEGKRLVFTRCTVSAS
jgi:hypothetical protein